jgi:hypothetical protein
MRHLESNLQIQCVKWFRYQYLDHCLFAIPNGGYRNPVTASIMKAEGVLSGVADLFLMYKNTEYSGLWIEMKTEKGIHQPSQKAFQRMASEQGFKYIVCRSFDDFKEQIKNYIDGEALDK